MATASHPDDHVFRLRLDWEALRRKQWATKRYGVHFSKSGVAEFRTCPYRWYLGHVEKRITPTAETLAVIRGNAVHAAIEAVLRNPEHRDPEALALEVLSSYRELADDDVEELIAWVISGVEFVRNRGGELRWVESLVSLDRAASCGLTAWGQFDVGIVGGALTGIEILDFKVRNDRIGGVESLRHDFGAGLYRLIAGGIAVERPIHVTELYLPSGNSFTVLLQEDAVREAWSEALRARDEQFNAIMAGDFPATPGNHCGSCRFRYICPAAGE